MKVYDVNVQRLTQTCLFIINGMDLLMGNLNYILQPPSKIFVIIGCSLNKIHLIWLIIFLMITHNMTCFQLVMDTLHLNIEIYMILFNYVILLKYTNLI